jgi:hypothetical protein
MANFDLEPVEVSPPSAPVFDLEPVETTPVAPVASANAFDLEQVSDDEAVFNGFKQVKPQQGFVPQRYEGTNEVWGGVGASVDAIKNAFKDPRTAMSTLNQVAGDVIGGVTLGTVTPRTGTVNVPFTGKPIAKVMPETEKLQEINPMGGELIGTMLPWVGTSKLIQGGVNALKGVNTATKTAQTLIKPVTPASELIKTAAERLGTQVATGTAIGAAQPAKDMEQRVEHAVDTAKMAAYMTAGGEALGLAGMKAAEGFSRLKGLPKEMKLSAFEKLLNEVSDTIYSDPKFKDMGFTKYEADFMAKQKVAEDINARGGWTKTTRKDFKQAQENIKKAREMRDAQDSTETQTETGGVKQEGPTRQTDTPRGKVDIKAIEADLKATQEIEIAAREAEKAKLTETETGTGTVTTEPVVSTVPDQQFFAGPKNVTSKQPVSKREGLKLQRIEEPGVALNFDKPHGVYTSPAGIESPHGDLGGDKHEITLKRTAKILDINEQPDTIIREGAINAGAGVHVARQLLGEDTFGILRNLPKDDLIAWANKRFTGTDFSKYFDTQEVLEAIGAKAAREAGYDAFTVNAKDPRWTETVVLNKKAVKSIKTTKAPVVATEVKDINSLGTKSEGDLLDRVINAIDTNVPVVEAPKENLVAKTETPTTELKISNQSEIPVAQIHSYTNIPEGRVESDAAVTAIAVGSTISMPKNKWGNSSDIHKIGDNKYTQDDSDLILNDKQVARRIRMKQMRRAIGGLMSDMKTDMDAVPRPESLGIEGGKLEITEGKIPEAEVKETATVLNFKSKTNQLPNKGDNYTLPDGTSGRVNQVWWTEQGGNFAVVQRVDGTTETVNLDSKAVLPKTVSDIGKSNQLPVESTDVPAITPKSTAPKLHQGTTSFDYVIENKLMKRESKALEEMTGFKTLEDIDRYESNDVGEPNQNYLDNPELGNKAFDLIAREHLQSLGYGGVEWKGDGFLEPSEDIWSADAVAEQPLVAVTKPAKTKTPREKKLSIVEENRKAIQEEMKKPEEPIPTLPEVEPGLRRLSAEQIDLMTDQIYYTLEDAENVLELLNTKGGKRGEGYKIVSKDFGHMLVDTRERALKTEDAVLGSPLFQTLEQATSAPRILDTFPGVVNTITAEVNKFYHTNAGDIVALGKQTNKLLDAVANNPRQFLKEFNGDLITYNEWVSQLNQLAGYINRVQKLRGPGTTMDFLGFQNTYNALSRAYYNYKTRELFKKMGSIKETVDGNSIQINYDVNKEKDIYKIGGMLQSGIYAVRNFPDALPIAHDIVSAELWDRFKTDQGREAIKIMEQKLNGPELKQLADVSYQLEEYSRVNTKKLVAAGDTYADARAIVNSNIDDFLDLYPNKKVVDAYKAERKFYDAWRERYKDHLISEMNRQTDPDVLGAYRDYALTGDLQASYAANGISTAAQKAAFKKYSESVEEFNNWGDEDYVTHMMMGDFVVVERIPSVDASGKPIMNKKTNQQKMKTVWKTVGRDLKDAMQKTVEYASEQYAAGFNVGSFTIDKSFAYTGDVATYLSKRQWQAHVIKYNKAIREAEKTLNASKDLRDVLEKNLKTVVGVGPRPVLAPPTLESDHVIPGEKNVFDGMRAYDRIMWKKVAYDPVTTDLQNANLPPNVRQHLETMLKDSKGSYGKVDSYIDDLLSKIGIDTHMTYTRFIANPAVGLLVKMKLMYRPATGVFNGIDAFSKILMEHKAHYFKAGASFLRTPQGRQLVESQGWSLGNRLDDTGHSLKTKQTFLGTDFSGIKSVVTPMGFHQLAELPARELNYAVAYTYALERETARLIASGQNVNNQAVKQLAIDFANRSARGNVWKLQGSNTRAERSEFMRGPTARIFTTFWPFFVRNVEFMASHSRDLGFWSMNIPFQLMMGGPRSIMALIRSVPFLELGMAAVGMYAFWDKLDLWMIKNIPGSGGIASFFGKDVVGPVTAQFPGTPAAIDTGFKLYKYVLSQLGQHNAQYSYKEGLKQTVVVAKNWLEIIDSHVDMYGRVRDEHGDPKYSITSDWDRAGMALGFNPESRTAQNINHRINMLNNQRESNQAKNIVDEFKNTIKDMDRRGADQGIVVKKAAEVAYHSALEHHVKSETLLAAVKNMEMSRELRDLFNTNVSHKLETFQRQQELEKKVPNVLFPHRKDN